MKSIFHRVSATASRLILLASLVALSILALLPEILCVVSLLAMPKIRLLSIGLALTTALVGVIGCSSKTPPATEPTRSIRWRGQDGGYEDTTTVQPTDAGSVGKQ